MYKTQLARDLISLGDRDILFLSSSLLVRFLARDLGLLAFLFDLL